MSENRAADGLEECITIQPAGENGGVGVLPYPYHVIVTDGAIGRQDYWRGDPAMLIGFADEPGKPDVDILREDWVGEPERAVGCYPVFATAGGEFATGTVPIESVQRGRARR